MCIKKGTIWVQYFEIVVSTEDRDVLTYHYLFTVSTKES